MFNVNVRVLYRIAQVGYSVGIRLAVFERVVARGNGVFSEISKVVIAEIQHRARKTQHENLV